METHANLENYDFNIAYNFLRKYDGERLGTTWLYDKMQDIGPYSLFNVLVDMGILVGEESTSYLGYRYHRVKLK